MPDREALDAVVGPGPDGLAAAITLAQERLSVWVYEGRDYVGGGLRSAELTLSGFTHDVCSAIPGWVSDPHATAHYHWTSMAWKGSRRHRP
jgi:phytoene dehydrogenase-like protein